MSSANDDLTARAGYPASGPEIARWLDQLPRDRVERMAMRAGYLFDGYQTLLFFMTGRDRTYLMSKVAEEINRYDKEVNINSPVVFPLDGYVGILFYLTRQSKDSETNRTQLLGLAQRLDEFANAPIEGKQIAPIAMYKMAVETRDKPGVLYPFARRIAERGGNIKRLEPQTLDRQPYGPNPDPWCLLTFTLEFPATGPGYKDEMKKEFEALFPDTRVYFDRDADEVQLRWLAAYLDSERDKYRLAG
jgi:hypothetical protein